MPLYEYQCDACGHRFEVIQKYSDQLRDICPKCGGPVKKLQSAPAFQFKGSGFYITDYPKKDQSPSEKDESGAKGSDSSGSEKKDRGGDKADKSEKADKVDRGDKKGGGAEKSDAAPKPEKSSEKGSSSGTGDSAPSGSTPKGT